MLHQNVFKVSLVSLMRAAGGETDAVATVLISNPPYRRNLAFRFNLYGEHDVFGDIDDPLAEKEKATEAILKTFKSSERGLIREVCFSLVGIHVATWTPSLDGKTGEFKLGAGKNGYRLEAVTRA